MPCLTCQLSGGHVQTDGAGDKWGMHSGWAGLPAGLEGQRIREGRQDKRDLDMCTLWGRVSQVGEWWEQWHNDRDPRNFS